MRIALVSPFEESVPPKSYGGTELVVSNIAEELVRRGHEVTLIAPGDSQTAARLLPVFPRSIRSDETMLRYRDRFKFIGTGRVVDMLRREAFDIVHNHLGWRLLAFMHLIETPMLTTLHGPLTGEDQRVTFGEYKTANYVSISNNQRAGMPDLHFVANVYNGIAVDKFKLGPPERSYLAFLGRMSPEKGPVEAIKIAKASGSQLRMAAKIDPVDAAYFEREVKPLIDGKQIQFIGEVNHERKLSFLGNAAALLMPINWEEPFGLVVPEAMACGTPVIGLRRGSLPELIIDGKVGFICSTLDEMVQRVADVGTIDPQVCRHHVIDNFSIARMVDGYLEAYTLVAECQ